MTDEMEVCDCNGVCKGAIVQAIKANGLFTLDDVKKHTKAASSCTGLVEQILASTQGGDYSPAPQAKPMCGCTDLTHEEVRAAVRSRRDGLHGMAHAQRLHQLPPGAQLLPAMNVCFTPCGSNKIRGRNG